MVSDSGLAVRAAKEVNDPQLRACRRFSQACPAHSARLPSWSDARLIEVLHVAAVSAGNDSVTRIVPHYLRILAHAADAALDVAPCRNLAGLAECVDHSVNTGQEVLTA